MGSSNPPLPLTVSRGSLGRLFLQRRCFGEQWFVSLQNKCRVSSRAGPPVLKLVLNCAEIGSEFSAFWCFLLFLVFAVETPKELWRGAGCQTTPSPGQRWVWSSLSWSRGDVVAWSDCLAPHPAANMAAPASPSSCTPAAPNVVSSDLHLVRHRLCR